MDKLKWLPADIFFVMHHDNKLSKVIAWFCTPTHDGKSFSHSGLILEQTDARTYTMETTDFEVVPNLLERYLTDPNCSIEVWRHPAISITERLAIAQESTLMDEDMYGYLQLLSLAIRNTLRKISIKINNFFYKIGRICCFVPMKCYNKKSSLPMMKAMDPGQLDTGEARNLVMAQGFELVFSK